MLGPYIIVNIFHRAVMVEKTQRQIRNNPRRFLRILPAGGKGKYQCYLVE